MKRKDNDNFHAGHEVNMKKPHLFKKIIRAFKSCFGHGFDSADAPSRRDYIRNQDAATGFEGGDIYGLQAEYLDDDDMAWGGGGGRKKSPRRQKLG